MTRILTLAGLAVMTVLTVVVAQTTPAGRLPVRDPLFADAAALAGLAELAISDLGVQKATDPELKKFSHLMIADHRRMNAELTALAAQKAYLIPVGLDPRAQFCAESLAGLAGEEFDRCYAKSQLAAHIDSVNTYESEAQRGLDADTKAFAARALPNIRQHLRMIKPIAMRYDTERGIPVAPNAPVVPDK
jgi:putative membrane protein